MSKLIIALILLCHSERSEEFTLYLSKRKILHYVLLGQNDKLIIILIQLHFIYRTCILS